MDSVDNKENAPGANDFQFVDKIWEESIHNMQLYHGTSVAMAETIGEQGVVHEIKPYRVDDLKYLDGILAKFGIVYPGSYSYNAEGKFYLTSSLEAAIDYAISGPEILSIHIIPYISQLLSASTDELRGQTISDEERDELSQIRQRAIDVLNAHRPAMVITDINAPAVKSKINEWGLSDKFYDQEAFKKYITQDGSHVDKSSVEFSARMMEESFRNFYINDPLRASDIRRICTGDDFFSLNWKSKEFGEVYKEVFYDIYKIPPDLVGEVNEFSDTQKHIRDIENISRFYGLSSTDTQTVIERARMLRKKRKDEYEEKPNL